VPTAPLPLIPQMNVKTPTPNALLTKGVKCQSSTLSIKPSSTAQHQHYGTGTGLRRSYPLKKPPTSGTRRGKGESTISPTYQLLGPCPHATHLLEQLQHICPISCSPHNRGKTSIAWPMRCRHEEIFQRREKVRKVGGRGSTRGRR
jgi:hypothetical protein